VNAPPRYQPLRPLPPYAYVPGRNPHPTRANDGHSHGAAEVTMPHLPAERWAENDAYLWGVDLYNAGYFWEAHEAWEGLWRAAPARDVAQRRFLQGLIQCAAACLKAAAGDAEACRRLAARGLARLESTPVDRGGRSMGVDIERFVVEFRRFTDVHATAVACRPVIRLT
jgi:uncharacterized protein